jgi:serine/threonine protein kinase
MLSGTVPFSGSSPLAIAMRHSTETPRRPSEFIPSIPAGLEEVVLHALEKNPEKRPSDANAFRKELYETAERLGLEHASSTTAPSIEAVRNAGTESPSGRLVVDLGRLREHRAATSGAGELPTINKADAQRILEENAAARAVPVVEGKREIRRLDIPLEPKRPARAVNRRPLAVAAVVIGLLLLIGIGFLLSPSSTPSNANVSATPSPTESPSPAASASPVASPKKEGAKKPEPSPTPHKKESKVGSVLNKVKKIFKKPF